jgi:putative acetyltransferase
MNITIRTEQISDYNQIAEINELAFYCFRDATQTAYVPEPVLVDILRHRRNFDPELSIVAERDGQLVGHAMYTPFIVRVSGEMLKAVALGPIAVHPAYQKQGIGMQLMAEGHRRAAAKGCAFAFLTGHDTYYPKVGYITRMFGTCHVMIPMQVITGESDGMQQRLIQPQDLPVFLAMWRDWFKDVDLALFPGDSLMDWVTHREDLLSYTMVRDGHIIGYLRYEKHNPASVNLFLARDRDAASLLLAHLRNKIAATPEMQIRLPVHPASQAVKDYLPALSEIQINPWDAAMIKILDPTNSTITRYCEDVQAGRRQIGLLIWPPAFEVA